MNPPEVGLDDLCPRCKLIFDIWWNAYLAQCEREQQRVRGEISVTLSDLMTYRRKPEQP